MVELRKIQFNRHSCAANIIRFCSFHISIELAPGLSSGEASVVRVGAEQRATEVGRDGGGCPKQNDLGKVKTNNLK